MDLDTARWLASSAGRDILARLPAYDEDAALARQTQLRAEGVPAEGAAAVLGQSRLAARAVEKFGPDAARLLYTDDGLAQATRPELAAAHARRFAATGIDTVLDLGCGIGSDAMAVAAAGLRVEALDVDPVTAALAAANLAQWPAAQAHQGRAEDVAVPEERTRHTGVWLDPARRIPGVADVRGRPRRTSSLADLAPPWSLVLELAGRVPATGAKLSPGLGHAAVPAGAEAQWTSWRGEVLECAVWWGPLVAVPGRTAAVCRPGSPPEVITTGDVRDEPPLGALAEVGAWLYEADRAVVAAGLSASLPGRELTRGVGYATGGAVVDLPWTRRYAVLEAMPLRVKVLRGWLRSRGIGQVTVKKRGASVDADALRMQLRGPGPERAVLVVSSVAARAVVLVVEPVGSSAQPSEPDDSGSRHAPDPQPGA
ncbi:MAG: methyltransferase domain-containing protein [Dermatophilaceae bacterium]